MTPEEIEILNVREKNERQLWAAVIQQALDDAAGAIGAGGGKSKEQSDRYKRLIRRRARLWFKKGGADFRDVCALADMDPDWIRANALKRIEEAGDDPISKRVRAGTITHNGERITLKELSARTGLSVSALHHRVKAGMTGEQLTAPSGSLQQKAKEITHNGETHTLQEWAEITGIPRKALYKRFKSGWTAQEALTPERRKPPTKMTKHRKQALGGFNRNAPSAPKEPRRQAGRLYEHAGKSLTLREWSNETGIPLNTLYVRLSRRGWSIEQALTTPLIERSKRHAGVEARAA
jgi:predicted DNA-binding transcriptional regulator AlpA